MLTTRSPDEAEAKSGCGRSIICALNGLRGSPGFRCAASRLRGAAPVHTCEQGIQQGIQQATREGLQRQRHVLTVLVQLRFGADVAEASGPLLARIDDPQRLDDLAEVGRDSPDAEAWLTALRQAAD